MGCKKRQNPIKSINICTDTASLSELNYGKQPRLPRSVVI